MLAMAWLLDSELSHAGNKGKRAAILRIIGPREWSSRPKGQEEQPPHDYIIRRLINKRLRRGK